MISARKKYQLVEGHSGLVAKLAWQSWRRMPKTIRCWLDPEDLMQEVWVALFETRNRYNKNRGMLEGSFYWMMAQSILANYAIALLAKKRVAPEGLVPIEDSYLQLLDKRTSVSKRVEAREALDSVYDLASEGLQLQMIDWFGLERGRMRLDGRKTELCIDEFRVLADGYCVTAEDCRIGMADLIGREWWLRNGLGGKQKAFAIV